MPKKQTLISKFIDTPLGQMLAISDEKALYLLEFVNRKNLEKGIGKLKERTQLIITSGTTEPIHLIENELHHYFGDMPTEFTTPCVFFGSPFQQSVWYALKKIPLGEKRSYADIAKVIGNPLAWRAVANANGANQLAIIIPCHRVITTHNKLGGYAGGVAKKEWLLDHEKRII